MKKTIEAELRRSLKLNEGESLAQVSRDALQGAIFDYAAARIRSHDHAGEDCERQVFYTTLEILPGRTLANNLMNLPEADALMEIMDAYGVDVNALENMEEEPRTGNGGMGRLAACMAESASAMRVPYTVSTIRYRHGLFRQEIVNGRQVAQKDRWLNDNAGYPFEICRLNEKQNVCFHEGSRTVVVEAMPFDIPVIGACMDGEEPCVDYIRMWAVSGVAHDFDMDPRLYMRIDDQLYPDDSTPDGKKLRLMQEYFLSSVTVRDMLSRMRANSWSVETLPDHFCLHMNDTHPVLMVPELMRMLRNTYGLSWDSAFEICRRVFVYTNHTIMSEALEKWDISLVEGLLPDVYSAIHELHRRFEAEIIRRYPGNRDKPAAMDILWNGQVRMANLAIYASYRVNGVAKIHTDILTSRELRDFAEFFPGRFLNVTNGVTQRKFLGHANPELSDLITGWTGSGAWRTDFDRIALVKPFADDPAARREYAAAHLCRKQELRAMVQDVCKVDIPVYFLYDVQVKRMHEYKRQQLNALKILSLYLQLKENPGLPIQPTAFIFAGKAADSYRKAKLVIELIKALEVKINADPDVNGKLRVAFVKDYNVTKAEKIFAAADLSEQISTASREASGTGNMKFMMNGAVTIGTLDGANVEIAEAVGPDNIYLFGLRKEEVMDYEANGGYSSLDALHASPMLHKAVRALMDGTIRRAVPDENGDYTFRELVNDWLFGEHGNMPDRFFVLKDFDSYMQAFMQANHDFGDFDFWNRKAILNIACSASFSSDRMVRDYREKVWKV